MEAKEIQIGDLLYYKGQFNAFPFKVESITKKMVGYHAEPNEHRINYLRLSECKPIHLTPEILEKNGFVANKHVYPYPYYEYTNEEDKLKIGFTFPQGERTSYKESWVYIDSERVFVEHLPCIFAHQLQQALRLCGIEKEIVL
jgi:hypothetical protein